MEESYRVKTTVGTFHVEKTVERSYSTGAIKFEYLHIGAKNKCVMFRWSHTSPEVVELQWLNTRDQHCETSGLIIQGTATKHLFNLAITLLRKYAPVKRLEFQDNSQFPCKLPSGVIQRPSLKHYYFMFHGKTWYEDKFGAVPVSEEEKKRYDAIKHNLVDPAFKPRVFSFINKDIDKIFDPIYNTTHTWKEFLDTVKTFDDYCVLVFPWYMYAVRAILDEKTTIPDIWKIEIGKDYPTIEFTRVLRGGGTRKVKSMDHTHYFSLYDTPNFTEIAEMDFGPLVKRSMRQQLRALGRQ